MNDSFRARRRFGPRSESLEGRNLLSALTVSAPAAVAGTPTVEVFVAKMVTSYNATPGQAPGQAKALTMKGSGWSATFIPADLVLTASTPTDRANGTVTGQATITDRGGDSRLVLDLTATPTAGLPIHYAWTVDPASTGIFTNAGGAGVVQVRYFAAKGHGRGATSGQAHVGIQGEIDVFGAANG